MSTRPVLTNQNYSRHNMSKRKRRNDVTLKSIGRVPSMGEATDVYHFSTEAPQRPPRCPANTVARGATIVVDNGSYQCRVGWAGQEEPRVAFRALLHRPKAKVRHPACVAAASAARQRGQ